MRGIPYSMKQEQSGGPAVHQGLVHGLPVTYNPDDDRFYIHEPGTTDGTNVMARVRDWKNAVQTARRLAAKATTTAPKPMSDGSEP